MRTPLNTLFLETQSRTIHLDRGNLEFLDEPNLRKMVARDHRQVESMMRLIDDMLDVSRIRSGQLSIHRQQTELSGLLERVVNDLKAQAEAIGTAIELRPMQPVTGM